MRQVPYVNFPAQYAEQRDKILACVESVFSEGQFIFGDPIEQLEKSLADLVGVKHAVCLNSGTDAIILALKALDIGPSDEVITPPNSFLATTGAIIAVGATPVFADVGDDQNMDPALVKEAITAKTKAIMPVHLTGRMCDMDALSKIARQHNVKMIEDSAQAIGSKFNGRASGAFSDVGCFSTHPLKNLNAGGDGGFITTDDGNAAERIKKLRNHGLVDRDIAEEWGIVSRMDTLQAAILLSRLGDLPKIIERRRKNADIYRSNIDHKLVFIPPCRDIEFNTFHTIVIQVDRRDDLQAHLIDRGIGCGVHYPTPIHLQPAARALGHNRGDFPVTERQSDRILSLPIHQFLDESDIVYVCETINEFLS